MPMYANQYGSSLVSRHITQFVATAVFTVTTRVGGLAFV